MKLAVTGPIGTGKTSLANRLSEHYSLSYIEDHHSWLQQANNKDDVIEQLSLMFQKKLSLETSAENFITDRCTIDLIHTCLNHQLFAVDRGFAESFIEQCVKASTLYDFVIILPWNSIPEDSNSDNNASQLAKLKNHACFIGYTHMWVNKSRIIEVPQSLDLLEDRLTFVDEIMKRRKPEIFEGIAQATIN